MMSHSWLEEKLILLVVPLVLSMAGKECCAADELSSFLAIQEALLQGWRLQMTVTAASCSPENWPSQDKAMVLNLPLRHWRMTTAADGSRSIRSDDFGIVARNDLSYMIRSLAIHEDDTVVLALDYTGDQERPSGLVCSLGEGISTVQDIGGNVEMTVLETYDLLKDALLAGRTVTAVGYLSRCSNAEEVFPPGEEFLHGFVLENAGLVDQGTEQELMAVFEASLDAPAPSPNVSVTARSLYITKYGGISVQLAAFGVDEDGHFLHEPVMQAYIGCTFEDFLFATSAQQQEQQSMNINSYEDLKTTLLMNGPDVQYQVLPALCEQIDGIGTPVEIGIRRFDQYQINLAAGDSSHAEKEHILFSTYTIDATGRLITDIVKVYPDDVSVLQFGFIDLLSVDGSGNSTGNQTSAGSLRCPLGDAAVFQAVEKQIRVPLWSFGSIYASLQNGSLMEVEIAFDKCDGDGALTQNTIHGGILWEMIGEDAGGLETYVFGSTSAYLNRFEGFTDESAWMSATFAVYEEGTVFVSSSLLNFASGESVASEVLVCRLKSSEIDVDASAAFYLH